MISPQEHAGWLDAAHGKPVAHLVGLNVADLFERQAGLNPDHPALVFADETLSYREMHDRANRLARLLIARGVGPEDVVALLLHRSVHNIVAMLAVLKAGAAFLPLDPTMPPERRHFMLTDSHPRLIISTQASLPDGFTASAELLLLDTAPTTLALLCAASTPVNDAERLVPLLPVNLAYLIYTSGSTGQPKGAGNTHAALANKLLWMQDIMRLSPADRVLQKTAIVFDVAVSEWMLPLLYGATLVGCSPDGHRDPAYMNRMIREHAITTVHFVPSVLEVMIDALGEAPACPALRQIAVSGETLGNAVRETTLRMLPHTRLWNLYGPTETAIHVTFWPCRPEGIQAASPIGWPIWNTSVYILDDRLEQVPNGEIGEIYLAGISLARGYLGRPGLTAERFIACPFGPPGERMYRTGDLGRRREDGVLCFLGRTDHQIKIAGLRIEPGDIEAALLHHFPHCIAQVAVMAQAVAGAQHLVAYLVLRPGTECPDTQSLRTELARSLVETMIPSAFVVLPALPLMQIGKLDRTALPPFTPALPNAATRAPRSPEEALLCRLFAEVTGAANVGVDDSFFALGGDSLLAMRLISRLRQNTGDYLPLKLLFQNPTPCGLAQHIAARKHAPPPEIRAGAGRLGEHQIVLSHGQQGLWALDCLDNGSSAYNIPIALRLHGRLNHTALTRALRAISARHEVLRTVIMTGDDGRPVGVVLPPADPARVLPVIDLSGFSGHEQAAQLAECVAQEIATPFHLASDRPWRCLLIMLSAEEAVLALTLHHHAVDGATLGALANELACAYAAEAAGRAPNWPALPVQYSDWAAWQQTSIAPELSGMLARAKARLVDAPALLTLPLDHRRSLNRPRRAGLLAVEWPTELVNRLRGLARSEQTTLFAVVLAIYAATLGRLAGQDRVVIGSPSTGNTPPETEGLIGFFVSTLAHMLDVEGSCSGQTLIRRARASIEATLVDQALPFDRLIDELGIARSAEHSPLFQAALAFQTYHQPQFTLPGLELTSMPTPPSVAKYDVTLTLIPTEAGGLAGHLEYDADLFDAPSVTGWAEALANFAAAIATAPAAPIATLQLTRGMPPAQPPQQVPSQTVVAAFAAQVALLPKAVALIDGDVRLSYAELATQADAIAHALRRLGIATDGCVAVLLDRSAAMISTMLGILKAGAAYMALDPNLPAERLGFMLADSGARLTITTTRHAALLPDTAAHLCLDDPAMMLGAPAAELPQPAPAQLAYLTYTSGSSGRPKAVATTHANVCALAIAPRYCPIDTNSVLLQLAPTTFDAATFEIWGALLNGATLVIHHEHPADLDAIQRAITRHHVTTLWLTAGLFSVAVENAPEMFAGLRHLLVGGDVVSPAKVRTVMGRHTGLVVINGYGPTETTTFAATWPISLADTDQPSLPIGSALAHATIYLLDETLSPVPDGVVGEIYIGGSGLARGYLGRPSLTAERFLACPFGPPGSRMYRTGDLGRRRSDGAVLFLGRVDDQVKIRGFRVEPGEIEEALLHGLPASIAQAAVIAQPFQGGKRLVAHLVAHAGHSIPSASDLRAALALELPEHMIPAVFIVADALGLTRNGKLDRHSLLQAAAQLYEAPQNSTLYRAPGSALETLFCQLFARITGAEQVSIDDSFFSIGGDSLLTMRLVGEARRHGLHITPRDILRHQTPQLLARLIASSTLPEIDGGARMRVFLLPGAGGDEPALARLRTACAEQLDLLQLDYGDWRRFVQPGFGLEELVDELTAQITKAAPDGPIRLIGYSLGGQLAWTIATRLEAMGRVVNGLVMLDSVQAQHLASGRSDARTRLRWRDEWRQLRAALPDDSWRPVLARIVGRRLLTTRGRALLRQLAARGPLSASGAGFYLAHDLTVSLLLEHSDAWAHRMAPPGLLHAPVTLLRADQNPDPLHDLGWQALCRQLAVQTLQGDHFSMLDAEHTHAVAAKLVAAFVRV